MSYGICNEDNMIDNNQLLKQEKLIEQNNSLIQDNKTKLDSYEKECDVLKLLTKQSKSTFNLLKQAKSNFKL